jgi:ABC-2 type transport system permease protein
MFALWISFRVMIKQQLLLLLRYPINLLANFMLILIIVVAMILIVTVFAPEGTQTRLRGITLYGSVIYILLSQTIWTVGMSIQKEQVEGTLTSFYLTPASRFLTLLARSIVVLAWTVVASFIGFVSVQFITGPLFFHNSWLALGILLFTASSLIGLGFAMAGLALRFGETIEIIANLLEFALLGVCAFFFPFSVLPPVLESIARLIPLSYAVDAFRTVALGEPRPELLSLNLELTIIIVAGLLGPWLGYFIYQISEKNVRQQGTL